MRSRLLAIRAISQEPSNTDVQCDLALLADSIVDAKDGKISALGTFDRIEAKPLRFPLESAMTVVRLKGRAGREVRLDQKVVSPTGEEMASTLSGPCRARHCRKLRCSVRNCPG